MRHDASIDCIVFNSIAIIENSCSNSYKSEFVSVLTGLKRKGFNVLGA